MRISLDKIRVAGASAVAVSIFFFLDLYVFAKSHSTLGSMGLGIICFTTLWVIVVGPCAELFLPYRRQDYRVTIFVALLIPFATMLVYLPLVRFLNVDAAARIVRYGIREYSSFADLRSNFHGLIRIRDAHINVPASMYYPPDDEFSGEIYYAVENSAGVLEAIYIESIYHRQQDFIDNLSEDTRMHRPLTGFIVNESQELDRCGGVLNDGAIKYGWKNTDNAYCLRYVPSQPDFVQRSKVFMWVLLPLILFGHVFASFASLQNIP